MIVYGTGLCFECPFEEDNTLEILQLFMIEFILVWKRRKMETSNKRMCEVNVVFPIVRQIHFC